MNNTWFKHPYRRLVKTIRLWTRKYVHILITIETENKTNRFSER